MNIKSILLASTLFVTSTTIATAATIWTDWTDLTLGYPGTASGTLGTIEISYSGEVFRGSVTNVTPNIWNPETTYVGGLVDTSPDTIGDYIGLNGSTNTGTITFSSTVTNPVIAIWSLGSPSTGASFTFDAIPVLQVGGPNSSYGGSSIVVNGNTVSGNEGNGVVLFEGNYSSLSWISTNENWYAFTVGSAVPIPAAAWLFGSGLIGLIGVARRKKV